MPEQTKAQAIFIEVLARTLEEREAYLDSCCGDDPELRREVEALLATLQADRTSPPEILNVNEIDPASARGSTPEEAPGAVIGNYRLLERIGEGGFGSVWMAEQQKPVTRRVALKVIKLGMDTQEVIARFEAERQTLALLDHPNIAKVFDAGATAGGRPYFVMELVKGVPIIQYCDAVRLDTRDRLKLFIKVCQAIQHAHQKGIIHRDIKPSNVLVTLQEGMPVPKVIDFGIAKATDPEHTHLHGFTQHGQMIGTPLYISPEQASMTGADVDTRSDIYSLGVLLYELLTGVTPFDVMQLMGKGFGEMMRVFREDDPERPSTRLRNLDHTQATGRSSHQADPRRHALALRGDLDWIVMKCLEKDRARRYETAGALAEDIRRHLHHEPVLAGSPSVTYRMGKFVRRYRTLVAAGSLAVVALVLGVIGATWGMVRALHEQAKTAEALEELRQVTAFQARQLEEIDAPAMGERLRTEIAEGLRTALGQRGLDEDSLAAVTTELDAALRAMNFTDVTLRTLDESIFEWTLATIEKEFHDQPLIKARLLQSAAMTLRELGLLDRAMAPQQEAVAIGRGQIGEDHPETIGFIRNMGILLRTQGHLAEAEPYYREALERSRRVLGEENPQTITTVNSMGVLLRALGQLDEAEVFFREALEKNRRVLGEDHLQTVSALNNVGAVLWAQRRHGEAEPFFREALENYRRILGPESPQALMGLNNLGSLLRDMGKHDEAAAFFREALDGTRRELGNEHPQTLTLISNMGGLLRTQGKLTEAEPYYREALETRRRTLGEDHPDTLTSMNNMGGLLDAQGKHAEAEALFRATLDGRRRVLGADHPHTLTSISQLGLALRTQGKFDQAETLLREALAIRRRILGREHRQTLISAVNLARVLQRQGDVAAAAALLTEEEGIAREVFADREPILLAGFLSSLGEARMSLGGAEDLAAAETALLDARRIFSEVRGEGHESTRECVESLVNLYESWHTVSPGAGHDAAAARWRARLDIAN